MHLNASKGSWQSKHRCKALQAVVQAAVTDEALQALYDTKYASAPAAKEYSAQHILVDSEEKATELKAQIDGGADFAELAKTNSSDTGSAVNGGDLGWFGLGMMRLVGWSVAVPTLLGAAIGLWLALAFLIRAWRGRRDARREKRSD